MPQLSKRGEIMPASPIRRLVPLAVEASSRGIKIYSLNIGQPDVAPPREAFEALRNIDRPLLEYSPSEGILSLRKKLCSLYRNYGENIDVEDIIITTGGSEALKFAFLSCFNPGDEIIIPEPTYANYTAFAITTGIKVTPVTSTIENGFRLPPIEEFEKLITPATKGILICNPNNPTGYIYTPEELDKLHNLVKKYDLFLISDEVYRDYCYADAPYTSALTLPDIEDNVIVIDSMSKRYSECGIRIGALVTKNAALRKNIMKFCQARLSPPLLGQIVAEASIDSTPSYIPATYEEYVARRNFLVKRISEIPGCYTPMPMGAFYTVVKLPVDDADKFCQWCLKEFNYEGETVFMAPASGFYTTPGLGRDQVRIAYVLNIPELDRAMEVLGHALEAYPYTTY